MKIRRNDKGEVIPTKYKGKHYLFEDNFEFFEQEVVVGSLAVLST